MMNDNFLALYNANNALLKSVSEHSFKATQNYARAEFASKQNEGENFDEALKEQTDAFEAFLIKNVLDISMKNKPSLFEKDASDDIYASMYNDTMSKALSGGLGFSELLFNFLKERA